MIIYLSIIIMGVLLMSMLMSVSESLIIKPINYISTIEPPSPANSRRSFVNKIISRTVLSTPLPSLASTIPQIPTECTASVLTADCLGVVDGLLADCIGNNCVSTQNDDPRYWTPPWEYEGGKGRVLDDLIVVAGGRGDFNRVVKIDREVGYVRMEFKNKGGGIDDAEFLLTEGDYTVQARCKGRSEGLLNGGQKRRVDEIRRGLGFAEIPVLRNRRRKFVVVESPWDDFGPSSTRDQIVKGR